MPETAEMHNEVKIELSPDLDMKQLQQQFRDAGFLHIPGVLKKKWADRIHKCLVEDVIWNMVFNQGKKHYDLFPNQISAMTKEETDEIRSTILSGARLGFQYTYNNYPIFDAYKAGLQPELFLNRVYEFINSETFLGFIRKITGMDDIVFGDAQATAYGPGHFLTNHSDEVEGKHRSLAFVFNFTPFWREDWGGMLQFYDDNGHIIQGLRPTYNALNLLTVPSPHAVSFVPPFADGIRYSIQGWLRRQSE